MFSSKKLSQDRQKAAIFKRKLGNLFRVWTSTGWTLTSEVNVRTFQWSLRVVHWIIGLQWFAYITNVSIWELQMHLCLETWHCRGGPAYSQSIHEGIYLQILHVVALTEYQRTRRKGIPIHGLFLHWTNISLAVVTQRLGLNTKLGVEGYNNQFHCDLLLAAPCCMRLNEVVTVHSFWKLVLAPEIWSILNIDTLMINVWNEMWLYTRFLVFFICDN